MLTQPLFLLHLPPELLGFVLSLPPPPSSAPFLFVTCYRTSEFCKILQANDENAQHLDFGLVVMRLEL